MNGDGEVYDKATTTLNLKKKAVSAPVANTLTFVAKRTKNSP